MFYPDKNFIATLSQAERFIFLKVICGMVAADRKITREELMYLKDVAAKYEVGAESLSVMIKTADRQGLIKQARMITSRPKALMLIKDLCLVANNDIEFADQEIDYILDIAEAMNIDPDRVKEINMVVNDYLAVSERARALLEQDSWI